MPKPKATTPKKANCTRKELNSIRKEESKTKSPNRIPELSYFKLPLLETVIVGNNAIFSIANNFYPDNPGTVIF